MAVLFTDIRLDLPHFLKQLVQVKHLLFFLNRYLEIMGPSLNRRGL